VRVIAGTAKGRRLAAPPGARTRPTADRVKEALFSSLQLRVPGAHVLDLYAGSGALGVEALSRGAAHATFVESHGRAVAVLEQNLELTGLVGDATVVGRDVASVLAGPVPGAPFDIVLLDPPYAIDRDELAEVLAALVPHLADGAVVSVELATRGEPPRWPDGLRADRERRYGDTTLHTAEVGAPT
jgi:16S rRNA (guanine966-N2)-methyltransferase